MKKQYVIHPTLGRGEIEHDPCYGSFAFFTVASLKEDSATGESFWGTDIEGMPLSCLPPECEVMTQ